MGVSGHLFDKSDWLSLDKYTYFNEGEVDMFFPFQE